MPKLSAAALNTLPPGDHTDHVVPGLTLTVGARRRTWSLRYRAGGKQHKPVLGHYIPNAPEDSESMGLLAAREKAREILSRVEAGIPAPQEKPVHPKDAMTLGVLINKYEEMRRAKGGRGIKSLDEALRTVRRCCADYIDLPARAFSKADLKKCRDKAAKGIRRKNTLQMADRFMSYLSPILDWAAKEDHIELNLVTVTHKVGPGTVKRKRILTNDEMRAIWFATYKLEGDEAQAYGRLCRFLLVVAQRKMECAVLRHGVIIDGRWKQTEDDNKSSREHLLRLPSLAVEQLGTGKANDLCFPGKIDGKPLAGFSKFKGELDGLSGVTGWRHHDLRRTATTRMQEMADDEGNPLINRDTITAILNHALQGADSHYLHATLNKAKSRALELWADELKKILGKSTVSNHDSKQQ
ncbi:tyrosine-type recombinase/integrase [Ensifer sp. MJa1]|uniref:tyrosine-type recombinase/integrase n=1 Tax=Ensifer sp. MJa1 TaxID=2919888 RepID=UPI00300BF2BD